LTPKKNSDSKFMSDPVSVKDCNLAVYLSSKIVWTQMLGIGVAQRSRTLAVLCLISHNSQSYFMPIQMSLMRSGC